MGARWKPHEIALVRDNYGEVAAAELAEFIGRTVDQVRDMARKLGVTRSIARAEAWTEGQLAALRRDYGKKPAAEIAAEIGRTVSSVYQRARTEGLGNVIRPWSDAETETLKAMNADGVPDSRIAAALRRDRHAVSARRKALGLPSREKGEMWRQAISAGVKRQCARLGLSGPTELRTAAFRRFARESGWPEDLRPREVQILNVLADRGVPMTRLELAEAIGMRTDRIASRGTLELLTGNGPGGTYTATLIRRGMLLKLKRAAPGRPGKGCYFRCRDLYYLGPVALAILEERACRQKTESVSV